MIRNIRPHICLLLNICYSGVYYRLCKYIEFIENSTAFTKKLADETGRSSRLYVHTCFAIVSRWGSSGKPQHWFYVNILQYQNITYPSLLDVWKMENWLNKIVLCLSWLFHWHDCVVNISKYRKLRPIPWESRA